MRPIQGEREVTMTMLLYVKMSDIRFLAFLCQGDLKSQSRTINVLQADAGYSSPSCSLMTLKCMYRISRA